MSTLQQFNQEEERKMKNEQPLTKKQIKDMESKKWTPIPAAFQVSSDGTMARHSRLFKGVEEKIGKIEQVVYQKYRMKIFARSLTHYYFK